MPILALGPSNLKNKFQQRYGLQSTERSGKQLGFSLLEVLIVLVIIGIATATVSIAAFSGSDTRSLHQDAYRLTQLFALAQIEARNGGSLVVWTYDSQGYGFSRIARDQFLPTGLARQAGPVLATEFDPASALRKRHWTSDNAITVRVSPATATTFNTEWVSGPLAVELDDGTHTVRIVRQGNGQYQVVP